MHCGDDVNSLIDAIYPSIAQRAEPDKYFAECTVLSCKNDDVDSMQTSLPNFLGKKILSYLQIVL